MGVEKGYTEETDKVIIVWTIYLFQIESEAYNISEYVDLVNGDVIKENKEVETALKMILLQPYYACGHSDGNG